MSRRVNKTTLINLVANQTGIPKKSVSEVIDSFVNTVTNVTSKDGSVVLRGFGKFYAVEVEEGKVVTLPGGGRAECRGGRRLRFKPGQSV